MSKTVHKLKFANNQEADPSKCVYTNWDDYTNSTPIKDIPVTVVLFVTEYYLRCLKVHPDVLNSSLVGGYEINDKAVFYERSLENILGVNLISVVKDPEDMRVEVWHK